MLQKAVLNNLARAVRMVTDTHTHRQTTVTLLRMRRGLNIQTCMPYCTHLPKALWLVQYFCSYFYSTIGIQLFLASQSISQPSRRNTADCTYFASSLAWLHYL